MCTSFTSGILPDMETDPETRVTCFRSTLDPLDIYRLDDIIACGGSADTTTPAAALVTYLRSLNPELWWNTDDLIGALAEELPTTEMVDVSGQLMLDAASFETEDSSNCFMALRRIYSFAAISRNIWFTSVTARKSGSLPRATTTGIVAYDDPRGVPLSEISTASGIARLRGPVTVDLTMMFPIEPHEGEHQVTETKPYVPAGFTAVGWSDKLWRDPKLRTPGYDFTADVSRGNPSAIVSSVVQGNGYTQAVRTAILH